MDGSVILVFLPTDPDVGKLSHPPLGLLYLGAVLREHGIPAKLFDFQTDHASWQAVEKAILEARRCLVGFACNSDNIHRVVHASDRLLSRHRNVTVVLGGPHVTHVWKPYVTNRRIVVRGEGEFPLLLLAKHVLQGKGALGGIPGIVYRARGKARCNRVCLGPYENVDAIPFPDYSLLHSRDRYHPTLTTSRGCPYQCFFCTEGNKDRRYRPRSAQNVEQELLALKELYDGSVGYLGFVDDTFTASSRRVHEMCDVLDRIFPDKSRFGFYCEGRVDVLAKHPALIPRLRDAGLMQIDLGIESGNQNLLNAMNKKTRVEQIETVVAACNDAAIAGMVGAFICGLPGQTQEDVEREIEFARHLVDLAPGRIELIMTPLVPYPGTEFRAHARKWGLSILDPRFVAGKIGENSFSETSELSQRQIESLCRQFNYEVDGHFLEKASCLSPRQIKDLLVLAANLGTRTFLVDVLCQFRHIKRILRLRCREDYRFLSELPSALIQQGCFPQRVFGNSVTPCSRGFLINERSPMGFELTGDEMEYYLCLSGKLTFRQIARRLAKQGGLPEKVALESCLNVYRKCEDYLAAIVAI